MPRFCVCKCVLVSLLYPAAQLVINLCCGQIRIAVGIRVKRRHCSFLTDVADTIIPRNPSEYAVTVFVVFIFVIIICRVNIVIQNSNIFLAFIHGFGYFIQGRVKHIFLVSVYLFQNGLLFFFTFCGGKFAVQLLIRLSRCFHIFGRRASTVLLHNFISFLLISRYKAHVIRVNTSVLFEF